MGDSQGYILLLAVWWFIFFYRELTTWRQATGELLGNHFPHWCWLGQKWRWKDNIYYYFPACLPFLSSFYPFHVLSAFLFRKARLNSRFRALNFVVLAHYLLQSIFTFIWLKRYYSDEISLFGALTFTYMSSNLKLHNPCIPYTVAWIPGMFMGGWIGAISLGMALLGGYYPILVYIVPFAVFFDPFILVGIVLGAPQLAFFAWYLPRSVRWGQSTDKKVGSVPLWRFLNLLGFRFEHQIRGLLPLETEMYIGLVPLFLLPFSTSRAWMPALASFILALGLIRPLLRHSARFLYPMTFFLVWMSLSGLYGQKSDYVWPLLILQMVCLWHNRGLYPMIPHQQHEIEPEKAFWNPLSKHIFSNYQGGIVSGLPHPLNTGYMFGVATGGYTGGLRMKVIDDLRNIEDPNGESVHDWFLTNDDNDSVKWAYRPAVDLSNEWQETEIKGLWKRITQ